MEEPSSNLPGRRRRPPDSAGPRESAGDAPPVDSTGSAAPDPESGDVDAEVNAGILRYRYRLPVAPGDLAALGEARPIVRRLATAARPSSVDEARRLMRIMTEFAIACSRTAGLADLDGALTPELVDRWIGEVAAGRSCWQQQNARWALGRIGRAVNPDAWPPEGGGRR